MCWKLYHFVYVKFGQHATINIDSVPNMHLWFMCCCVPNLQLVLLFNIHPCGIWHLILLWRTCIYQQHNCRKHCRALVWHLCYLPLLFTRSVIVQMVTCIHETPAIVVTSAYQQCNFSNPVMYQCYLRLYLWFGQCRVHLETDLAELTFSFATKWKY